jgi:hypothetical protein
MSDAAAPPREHPLLGLGGRSIELSLAQGAHPDPNAFSLAVDELHRHVAAADLPGDQLASEGRWLLDLANDSEMPTAAREQLTDDLRRLG